VAFSNYFSVLPVNRRTTRRQYKPTTIGDGTIAVFGFANNHHLYVRPFIKIRLTNEFYHPFLRNVKGFQE